MYATAEKLVCVHQMQYDERDDKLNISRLKKKSLSASHRVPFDEIN